MRRKHNTPARAPPPLSPSRMHKKDTAAAHAWHLALRSHLRRRTCGAQEAGGFDGPPAQSGRTSGRDALAGRLVEELAQLRAKEGELVQRLRLADERIDELARLLGIATQQCEAAVNQVRRHFPALSSPPLAPLHRRLGPSWFRLAPVCPGPAPSPNRPTP